MFTIEWRDGHVRIIDQTKLPLTEEYRMLDDYHQVAEAIKSMRVRGAPAIGVTAALGYALAAQSSVAKSTAELIDNLDAATKTLATTRPTAVNLFWALDRMKRLTAANSGRGVDELKSIILSEALAIHSEDIEINMALGGYGAAVISVGDNVLTHCNAGALACAGFGTALGVIRAAEAAGKHPRVWVDETRPLLQGARLTAWELEKEGIAYTLITDNMAGYLMSQGKVDKVIVGADRIAANGDTANKIGTYSVACLASLHDVPFYVAAPTSTIDRSILDGAAIPIEQRDAREVRGFGDCATTVAGCDVYNPAFDVTPARLIAGIITEQGILRPPFVASIAGLK